MNETKDTVTEAVLQASRFWVQRVLVPIIVVIGVAGNTVTVMVLTRKRMRSSINVYLSALAIADIIHLFFVLLLSFKHYSNIHDMKYELYWRFLGLMHWFCDAASSTSIWLTVSFTVERYIAVCHPIRGRYFCTERRAKSIIVIVYIFCIVTTASTKFEHQLNLNETCIGDCEIDDINKPQPVHSSTNNALNISMDKIMNPNVRVNKLDKDGVEMNVEFPENAESTLEKPPREATISNDSSSWSRNNATYNTTCCVKHYSLDLQLTKLGENDTYTTIMYWYSSLFFCLIPLILIVTFNSFLVRAVYLSQRMRRQMTNSQESIGYSNEKKITIMLIGVIILFITCQTPSASVLIYNIFNKTKTTRTENIIKILGNFFNFLTIVNASCNFLLYCFFSKKFRSTFKEIFFERKKKKPDIILLSSTKSKNSQKFDPHKHGIMRRNASEYLTPRNLETQSLTSIPRSKSLVLRPMGKAKSSDVIT